MTKEQKILINLVKLKGRCIDIKGLNCSDNQCPIYDSNPVTKHRLGCGLSDYKIYEISIMLLLTDGIGLDILFDEVL